MADTRLIAETLHQPIPRQTIVLVGLMGSGKTTVGRRLARELGIDFMDADAEIEKAAGCTIPEIFESFGEPAFREGEKKVISRLLDDAPHVLATGGGAFMNEDTRASIKE
jgi:shikimate kinase